MGVLSDLIAVLTRRARAAAQTVPAPANAQALGPTRSWIAGIIEENFAGAWQRNVLSEDPRTLLAFSAVYACVALISGDVSKMRITLREHDEAGKIWPEVEEGSPFLPVLRKPNAYQTRVQFLQFWVASKLLRGNAYVLKIRDARQVVREMHPLHPDSVTPLVTPSGQVFYQVAPDNLAGVTEEIIVPATEMIHDRMNCLWHPLVGVSPLFACGVTASQGVKIQRNSSRFFENMSRPSGHLAAPGKIEDQDVERIKRQFEERFGGDNIGRLLVTGSGLKYEPISIAPDDAQMIEQLRWTTEDVARAFGVPGYKVGAGTPPALSNIGALQLDYYNHALQVHVESIEVLIDEALDLGPKQMISLDLESLLRMDPSTRAEIDDKRIKAGSLSPDEARRAYDLPPVEGGGTPYLQEQNYSLRALAQRDARPDPFAKGSAPPPPAEPEEPEEPEEPGEPEDEDEDEETIEDLAASIIVRFAQGEEDAEPV